MPDPKQFAAPRGLALVAHPHPLYGGTMDNNVIVGANSVVTRSVPDNQVIAGVPARVIKER